jgi:hypothetical protein
MQISNQTGNNDFEAAWDNLVTKQQLLPTGNWLKINLIQIGTAFSLLPEEAFNYAHLSLYANLIGIPDEQLPMATFHPGIEAYLVFGENPQTVGKLKEKWASASPKILQGIDGFLAFTHSLTLPGQQVSLFAHVGSQKVLIAAYKGRNLLLINEYPTADDNSLLYFVQLAAFEVGFSNLDDTLYLMGPILPGSAGYEKLSRFFAKVQLTHLPGNMKIPAEFAASGINRYALILSTQLVTSSL